MNVSGRRGLEFQMSVRILVAEVTGAILSLFPIGLSLSFLFWFCGLIWLLRHRGASRRVLVYK